MPEFIVEYHDIAKIRRIIFDVHINSIVNSFWTLSGLTFSSMPTKRPSAASTSPRSWHTTATD